MKTKLIKEFKTGEQFTLTPHYDVNTPVYTFEKFIDNEEIAVCRDQNGCGRCFESDDKYYPICFSSLDGEAYRP